MAFENTPVAKPVAPRSGVAFVRRELEDMFPTYDLISHCLQGSEAVKAQTTTYLPMPEADNTSKENLDRYEAYRQRAVFYNVTQRTALGLQGQVFKRAAIVKAPSSLEQVISDSDGSGISLEQLSRDAVWHTLGFGRCGLFIDYPEVGSSTSVAQQRSGNIRPTISVYNAKSIINWRTKTVKGRIILTLVVLLEYYEIFNDDDFSTSLAIQYRELRLTDDNRYFVQLWRAPNDSGTNYIKYGAPYFPNDGSGKPLDEIPFTFIGSKNNDPTIDPAPLLDIANINIAHYRNSADYEEIIYLVGQPMLVVTGLKESWYKEIMGGKVPFGSRSGMALHEGASADLIQVEESTMAFEAMKHKESQMIALGAQLVQEASVQRTATEAGIDNAAEESTLVAIAKNVSVAIKWALEWCAVFANVPETGVDYQLNTDFDLARMSAVDRAAVIKSWSDGAISFTEMRNALRKSGIATQTDEEAKAEIEKDQAAAIATAAAEIEASTIASNVGTP